MKTRLGFVSNSSSSSFVVLFDKKPESREELFKLMFPKDPGQLEVYDTVLSTDEIVDTVWKEIKEFDKPIDKKSLSVVIGCALSAYDSDLFDESLRKEYKEIEKARKKYDDNFYKTMFKTKNMKDKKALQVEYDKMLDSHYAIENEIFEKIETQIVSNLLKLAKKKWTFITEYSDNEGETNALMEHGEVFRNLTHYRFSHH